MILDAIRSEIITYPGITGYVSTFASSPAVFGNKAPDNVSYPYAIIRVNMSPDTTRIIDIANVYIDLYEESSSDARQITAAKSVLDTLDCKTLSNTGYSSIRCFRSSWGAVEEVRIGFKHYNLQFECRAIRKSWIQSKT